MLFDVVARQSGNTVQFPLEIEEQSGETDEMAVYKSARQKAQQCARTIFEFKGVGQDPIITVKQAKEQAVGG